jgi:transcriptional regulator with XRE-family HTH domain
MTFGEKLQLLRKQKGMSQEQLASQLTVSRQAVSKWELDSSLPDTENVVQLSKLFEVSIDYLLFDEIESNGDIPAVKENATVLKNKMHNTIKMILGIVCAGIGFLGNITLLILSTMIQVPVTKKYIAPDGSAHYYGGGDVLGYSFWGFIEKYRLMTILVIATILLVIGIICIVRSYQSNKTESFNQQIK